MSTRIFVPHHGVNKFSGKPFAVAGPRQWNELWRGCNSLDAFKNKLKILLFHKTLLMANLRYFIM